MEGKLNRILERLDLVDKKLSHELIIKKRKTESFETLLEKSDWGYLPTHSGGEPELFYFTAFSEADIANSPLLFWFNGGTGASSLIGLFSSIGPYFLQNIDGELILEKNEFNWNKKINLIALEQNLGVGYSKGSPLLKIEKMAEAVAYAMGTLVQRYEAQFSTKFSIYVTGQSLFGSFGPYIFEKFLENGMVPLNQIIGLGLGSPYADGKLIKEAYASYLANNGLANPYTIWKAVKENNDILYWWSETQDNYQTDINDKATCLPSNVEVDLIEFFDNPEVKELLGVSTKQRFLLLNSFIFENLERKESSLPVLHKIWNSYPLTRILIWVGDNDIVTPVTHCWQILPAIHSEFENAEAYYWSPCQSCPVHLWQDPKFPHRLALVCFKNAGHNSMKYQPCISQAMITEWVCYGKFSAQILPRKIGKN